MLKALEFVRGAVSKKDFQPALTHFLIRNGRVIGYDGTIALCSPIGIDIEAAPKALPFIKAIERCTSTTTSINLTQTGKITLRSGKFHATIECTEEQEVLRYIQPEGEDVFASDGLLGAFRALEPFVGTDASREWSRGILLRGLSAYATNNIILAQYWLGEAFPDVNLPASAIKELNRIGEQPVRIQLSNTSITFHFEGGRWLRSQLLILDWPDIDGMLEKAFDASRLLPVPHGFFEALEVIAPFVELEGRILFRAGVITTALDGGIGASVELDGLPSFGAYHFKQLRRLEHNVTHIDFTQHPQPCPFTGSMLRGVFLGMVDL